MRMVLTIWAAVRCLAPLPKNDAGYLGLDGLQSIRQAVAAPLVGIGGVNSTNFEQVLQTGVNGAAIVSGILAADDIEAEVRKFKTIADRYKKYIKKTDKKELSLLLR